VAATIFDFQISPTEGRERRGFHTKTNTRMNNSVVIGRFHSAPAGRCSLKFLGGDGRKNKPYVREITAQLGDKQIQIETGKLAKQADGAVTVQVGETIVLVAAVAVINGNAEEFCRLALIAATAATSTIVSPDLDGDCSVRLLWLISLFQSESAVAQLGCYFL